MSDLPCRGNLEALGVGWSFPGYGGRQAPFRIWGPTGTNALMEGLEQAYQADVAIRLADQRLSREGIAIAATDFAGESVCSTRVGWP